MSILEAEKYTIKLRLGTLIAIVSGTITICFTIAWFAGDLRVQNKGIEDKIEQLQKKQDEQSKLIDYLRNKK